nr:phage portal protein [Cellulosimicrobium arenosum]
MRVPAIAKGRGLICGTLSRQPLVAYKNAERLSAQPAWLYRTNTAESPYVRMLWTLDDLLFGGTSLWTVERGAQGQITDALRVPPEWWEIDPDGRILVYGKPVNRDEVLYFEGPQDGLLDIASEDIRAARDTTKAWSSRVKAPVPMVELHINDANKQLSQEESDNLLASWNDARENGGGTAITPAEIDVRTHGEVATDLYIQGRNASRLDFANYMSVPASLLEGSTATASLTYSTQEGARNELLDYTLTYWASAIEARLSMDDAVPRGQRVAFDLSYFTRTPQPSGPTPTED